MKTLEYQEYRRTNARELDKLQAVLNPYKPNKKLTPVIVYNDVLHFIIGYSFHVTGHQGMKLRLKPCGQDQTSFTVDVYETNIETIQYLTN